MKKTYMKPMLLAEDIETPSANSTCNMHDVNLTSNRGCTMPSWINDHMETAWDFNFFTQSCKDHGGESYTDGFGELGGICYQASTGTNIIYGS